MLGTGLGTFGAPAAYGTGTGPKQVATADFNGDTKPDLVGTSFIPPPGGPFGSAAMVFQNGQNGNFNLRSQNHTDSNPTGVVAVDLGGDAKPDFATANMFSDTLTLHQNTGTGSFAAAVQYIVTSWPQWVAAADFNGDGEDDLAVTSINGNSVTLSRRRPRPPPSGSRSCRTRRPPGPRST